MGTQTNTQHVVIVGGGFGGLYAAKSLRRTPVTVTLLDKRNFHLFQPLLYQVATGGLSPGDIASPLRGVLNRSRNTRVLKAEVTDIDPVQRRIVLRDGELTYDTLVVATGGSHHYFGHDNWASVSPGLKTVEDALEIRRRIFLGFEAAERESDSQKRREWMTFVVIGAGPTGVELAGAIGELAHTTLKNDFRNIDSTDAVVVLLEGGPRILPQYPPELSAKAEVSLSRLGVKVWTEAQVTDIRGNAVTISRKSRTERLKARTLLWAAGTKASGLGEILSRKTGVELDRSGRVMVGPDLTLPGHPGIFVIGDLANFSHQNGNPLPGVAPVAMQQGRYVADLIGLRLEKKNLPPFRYRNRGSLAVIGRHSGVADFGSLRFSGFPAWLIWLFVHIAYLIEYDNKLLVLFQWAWNYFTRKRGARLITGGDPFPLVQPRGKNRGAQEE